MLCEVGLGDSASAGTGSTNEMSKPSDFKHVEEMSPIHL